MARRPVLIAFRGEAGHDRGMNGGSILIVARVHGAAAAAGQLRDALDELAGAAAAEPGCRSFEVFGAASAGEFCVLSQWDDEEALRAHYTGDAYGRYLRMAGPLLSGNSSVVIHHVSASVRALDPNLPDPRVLG
jgi:quinol monooxygenase YgiN